MTNYTIKDVSTAEQKKLQRFLDVYWKKGHALATSSELLRFQHYDKFNDKFNFLVAENKSTLEYDALIGYIPTSQYDSDLLENGDYWGAIWKIRDDISNDELNAAGFFIWKKLFKLPYFQSYAAIGISEIAKKIYKASRMSLGYLSHYFVLNNNIDSFKIAANVSSSNKSSLNNVNGMNKIKWISLSDVNPNDVHACYKPHKSLAYFANRYVQHPIYQYRFLGIYENDTLLSLWSVRKISINGSNVLRVVDVLGELKGDLHQQLQLLLIEEDAEYIDFLNFGFDKSIFEQMGFQELDFNDDLIIPNYFEPFEQKNVKVELAYKANFQYIAFKGDADQDRPTLLQS